MTRSGQPKKFVFKRRDPDLPDEPELLSDPAGLLEQHDVTITGKRIDGGTFQRRTGGTLRIEGSVLDRVTLANAVFGSIMFRNVRLLGCDLANLETRGFSATRVEMINCRMTGFRAGEAECQDLLISEGDQRYSLFRFSRFQAAEFNSCNFSEADFQGTDLSGAIFRNCNLRNAEMRKVKLVNADLRGSHVEGLQLNAEDIRGAIVDISQAMLFAPLLGIRIQ